MGQFLRKMRINLLQDSAASILAIYPKNVSSYYRDTCSNMFIADLFIIFRNRNLTRCPSVHEWICQTSLRREGDFDAGYAMGEDMGVKCNKATTKSAMVLQLAAI